MFLRDAPGVPWLPGAAVSARLSWCDTPDLPGELLLRRAGLRATALIGGDGRPWAQLVRAGGLVAVRPGHRSAGAVLLDGCLTYEVYRQSAGWLPATTGTVRRVRAVLRLHDRGEDRWIPRPQATRVIDVPGTGPTHLHDDPAPEDEPVPGSMVLLSPEQYFAMSRERLPAQQWQALGFLVDLDVPAPDGSATAPRSASISTRSSPTGSAPRQKSTMAEVSEAP